MDFRTACKTAHVRSAIYRKGQASQMYWKNHIVPLTERVPKADQQANDWFEYDPREWDHRAGDEVA